LDCGGVSHRFQSGGYCRRTPKRLRRGDVARELGAWFHSPAAVEIEEHVRRFFAGKM
jgi:hypothetical protein